MVRAEAVVRGTIQPDGTLHLDERLDLPPGPVQVIVTPLPCIPENDPFWQRMRAIWAGQRERSHAPRSVSEVEDERRKVREEWEERLNQFEKSQGRAASTPDRTAGGPEG